jgi:L-rhamnose isomerase
MEIKESSIEWLMVKIHTTDWVNNTREEKLEIFEQAKEMHKQEIVDAYKFGISDEYVIGSEEYYNKTFGK